MIYIDLETYSEKSLRDVGLYHYAAASEILLCATLHDDVRRAACAMWTDDEAHALCQYRDAGERFVAHNAPFERVILRQHGVDIPPEQWDCTMVLALTAGLPAGLDALCKVLGLPEEEGKMKAGRPLISRFCKPAPSNHKADRYDQTTHPKEWAQFAEYCRRDAELVRYLWENIPHWTYKKERDLWLMDQRINDRGIGCDVEFAQAAIRLTESELDRLNDEIRDLTGNAVSDVNDLHAMRTWIGEQL